MKSPLASPKKQIGEPILPLKRAAEKLNDSEFRNDDSGAKRKCTMDVGSKGDEHFLMIENDEVSQKLLKKLTTPKPVTRYMSLSAVNHDRFDFNLDFNSDLESFIDDDEFEKHLSCGMLPLNDFVSRNINEYM